MWHRQDPGPRALLLQAGYVGAPHPGEYAILQVTQEMPCSEPCLSASLSLCWVVSLLCSRST